MNEWTIVAAAASAVVLAAALFSLLAWWNRRRPGEESDEYQDVADRLDLTSVQHRRIFGARVSRLRGELEEKDVEVEICHADRRPYTRIRVMHEQPLNLGIRILHDRQKGIWTSLVRMREAQLGDDEDFDEEFLLMAREEERLKKLLTSRIRRLFLDLEQKSADVRGGDEGLFIFCERALEPDEIEKHVRSAIRLVEAIASRAEEIRSGEAQEAEESETRSIFTPMPGSLDAIEFKER